MKFSENVLWNLTPAFDETALIHALDNDHLEIVDILSKRQIKAKPEGEKLKS